ncbi:MAG: OB-fold protein [Flavobacterium sp.]
MKKKVFILLVVIISASVAFYFYAYKSHRNIADETSEYVISVENFEKDFAQNDSLANLKYLDKTVEIKGKITAIETENKALIIDEKVFASFNDVFPNDLKTGKVLTVKGRFVGYDDLLEQYKIDQITIIN